MADLATVQRPVSELDVIAKFAIPGFPDWVGIDGANLAVWISNRDRNNVARIDPAVNRIVTDVAVGSRPCCGLTFGHGALWVPCCGDRTVVRVDPTTNRAAATIPVGVASSE